MTHDAYLDILACVIIIFFFFQAEDGIRDLTVTGVQTCALPICRDSGQQSLLQAEIRKRRAPRAARSPDRTAGPRAHFRRDRKSTRLNSSHSQISYAVFCLKKKKNTTNDASLSHRQ